MMTVNIRADGGLNSRYATVPFPQDMNRQQAKFLGQLSTEGVCQWFTRMGLQQCLPFIRGIEHILLPTVSFLRPTCCTMTGLE